MFIKVNSFFKNCKYPLQLIYLLFLLTACNKAIIPFEPKISLNIQDVASYQNDSISISDFTLSPFDNNSLWIFSNTDYAYELNLTDGSWSSLDKYFGEYCKQIEASAIYKDPFNQNQLWLRNADQGLLIYNIKDNQSVELPEIKLANSLAFTKKYVFAGTDAGLYKVKRSDHSVERILALSRLPVASVSIESKNLVRINETYLYDYETDRLSGKYTTGSSVVKQFHVSDNKVSIKYSVDSSSLLVLANNDTIKNIPGFGSDIPNTIIDNNVIWIIRFNEVIKYNIKTDSFIRTPLNYALFPERCINDDSLIWVNEIDGFTVIDKSNVQISKIMVDNLSGYNNFILNNDYLIAADLNKITVFKKEYLLRHSTNVNQLAFEEDLFETYVNEEITSFRGDFKSTIAKYNEAVEKFGNSTNKLIQIELQKLKNSINNSLPFNFKESLIYEPYVKDTLNDRSIAANYYLHNIELAIYEGKVGDAIRIDSLMISLYPEFRSRVHQNRMSNVLESYNLLSDLQKSAMNEEELLWKTGMIYLNLFSNIGADSEMGKQLSYPFSFFRRLLRIYPESPFADDADYQIMISYDHSAEQPESEHAWISNYKKFLGAYPTTNKAPFIYEKLVNLHINYCAHSNITDSEKVFYLEQAKRYLTKLQTEYPLFIEKSLIDQLDQKISNQRSSLKWSFQIRSDKKEYFNEPLIITYDLKNIDSDAKQISIFQENNIPNFITMIEYFPIETNEISLSGQLVEFLESDISESGLYVHNWMDFKDTRADSLISPGNRFTEEWDVQRIAMISLNNAPGKYQFTREGKYRITSRALADEKSKGSIQSNSIWITVLKKELSN